jgi:predicted ATPase/DNA-binding CsgD family transcriptional regulator
MLVGRERERAALERLIERDDVSLVSVTGPGGIGKTSLAMKVVEQARPRFEHGVAVVLLASVREPNFVAAGIANALGLEGQGNQPMLERVKNYLRERHLLLVLDNFEQVAQAAPVLSELRQAAAGLKMLVTSRVRLRISDEHEFPLGPLSLPRLPVESASAALAASAVALFVNRARAVQPEFALGNDNLQAVAGICLRLDGWPLAIELAAARVKVMPPQILLQRLSRRLGLLTGGPVDAPLRQRTLRATLDWSYELLNEAERDLLAQLSVFNGGMALDAVETVCARAEPGLLDTLEALIDHGLVVHDVRDTDRLGMLETIREYAAAKLQAGEQADATRLRHARYFLALAESAQPELRGPQQKAWLDRLAAEHDNFREALGWSLLSGQAVLALRLGSSLRLFWDVRGHLSEGRQWIEKALAAAVDASDAERGKALGTIGSLARRMGDMAAAKAALESALALYGGQTGRGNAPWVLRELGRFAMDVGEHESARNIFEACLLKAREIGNRSLEAHMFYDLGTAAMTRGDFVEAQPLLERAQEMSRETGDARLSMIVSVNLGTVAMEQGRYTSARQMTEDGLSMARSLGDKIGCPLILSNLGEIARLMGDPHRAYSCCKEAVLDAFESGQVRTIWVALQNLALSLIDARQLELAAKLLAAADVSRQSQGLAPPSRMKDAFERAMTALRAQLGPEVFEASTAEGRGLSTSQAVALARTVDVEAAKPRASMPVNPVGLTSREIEVLCLVAQSLSDREIARRLDISPATVSKHVANMLGKTMQPNRVAVTLWAIERGLVRSDCRQ